MAGSRSSSNSLPCAPRRHSDGSMADGSGCPRRLAPLIQGTKLEQGGVAEPQASTPPPGGWQREEAYDEFYSYWPSVVAFPTEMIFP